MLDADNDEDFIQIIDLESKTACARLISTSPEGSKRRKLSHPSSTGFSSASEVAPVMIQEIEEDRQSPPTHLQLTEVETTLRRLLLDVATYIDGSPLVTKGDTQVPIPEALAEEKTILRFTGGWVRDKLLGVPSHDIDVAINKMTGERFGLKMKEYLEIPGNPEKYGLEGVATTEKQSQKAGTTGKSKLVGGLHKIEANPEKSKHLETVTTRILGLDIDLVNLRKETYSADSRNPQMEFGTAEEDAMRRDATVNAMFYNLNTEVIEDLTGKGHDDMRGKIIRTPLEPYQTFDDDPLRVLRLIRFASRLDYEIEQTALHAMRSSNIQDSLRRKISRERIGTEMEKCLRGPDPHEALRLIFELGLYDTVFSDPSIDLANQYRPDTEGWQAAIDVLEDLISADRPIAELLIRDDEERFMAWQLLALVPYKDAPQPEPAGPGRKLPPPIAAAVAREGIKATNKVCDIVTAALRNQNQIASLVDRLHQQQRRPTYQIEGENAAARDVIGMAIRGWGGSWRSQVVCSFLAEAFEVSDVASVERRYTSFVQHVNDLDLLEACSLKPLLDGKALTKALDTPPGPWMKDALDVVMAWQLRNADVTDTSRAIEELKQTRTELTSTLVRHFLKLTIRPQFVKDKPSSLTEAGRRVTTATLPKRTTLQEDDEQPWKQDNAAHTLNLLRWVVGKLDVKLLEEVWPLVIPPVLTLVDDMEVQYKQQGVELLRQVLIVTPPDLLARTGLGSVFADALMPCLTYLPELTPEPESITLLNKVFPTLLVLSTVHFELNALEPSPSRKARIKYLDNVLRKGILYPYSQTNSAHLRITTVLFNHLVPLLNALGIETVRHLKYVLPILTETLTHRLATAYLPMLTSAVRAMQAVILNAWPRMKEHRGEVLKGLTICWVNLHDMDDESVAMTKKEMKDAFQMLRLAIGSEDSEINFEDECERLKKAESKLGGLFD